MPFCFLTQNFAEIGQSVDELWPKNRFSRRRPPPSWILKISLFDHVAVIVFNIWCSLPTFNKIGQFFTEIWLLNHFQNGSRPPSWIVKICSFCPVALTNMLFCLFVYNFAEIWHIGRWVMAEKAIFNMEAAAILNYKNFNFWSRGCHQVQYLMHYTIVHQNQIIFH